MAFLKPFQEATLALEKLKEPTDHRVMFFKQYLLSHCKIDTANIVVKEREAETR